MTKATVYRPVRKPVIPSADALATIFDAAVTATYSEARVTKEERIRRRKTFAAFVRVVYYTASRPESEACALTHGDLDLPDREKVRSIDGTPVPLGSVTFRDTKTGKDRRVPLHPEAEKAIRSIMLDYPTREDGEDGAVYQARVEAWEAIPLFRTEAGAAFTKDTYRKAWQATIEAATKAHPELKGMILRDLRKAANTRMRSTGTDSATAARVLGHSSEMNYRYVEATDEAARRAVLSL